MKVYLDYVFIENFIINLSILYQVSIFTKTKISKTRLILTSITFSIISVIKILNITNNIILQILVVFIGIYLLFLPKKIIKYFKYQMYYYLISITYIGIIISSAIFLGIKLNNIVTRISIYILSIVITYLINKYMWKMWINKIKYFNLTYKLVINSLDKIAFKVFVDTGHNIKDPFSNLDIIILNSETYISKLNSKKLDNIKSSMKEIEILTANGKSKIKGYIFNDISIRKRKTEKVLLKKAIILFIDEKINNNEYDGIISYNTYLEKLEGVSI